MSGRPWRKFTIVEGVVNIACTNCYKVLPATKEYFHAGKQRRFGVTEWCKDCSRAYFKEHYHKNKHRYAETGRAWRQSTPRKQRGYQLKKKFGITIETYELLLEAQGFKCAICKKDKSGGKGGFHVDHDHSSGRVRGLLCSACNLGLGWHEKYSVGFQEYLNARLVR